MKNSIAFLLFALTLTFSNGLFAQKKDIPENTNSASLDKILVVIKEQLESVNERIMPGYALKEAELSLVTTKNTSGTAGISLFDVVNLGGDISKEQTQTMTFSFKEFPKGDKTKMAALVEKEFSNEILHGIMTYHSILEKKIFPGLGTGSFTFVLEFNIEKKAEAGVDLWIVKVGGSKGWANGHSLSLTYEKQ